MQLDQQKRTSSHQFEYFRENSCEKCRDLLNSFDENEKMSNDDDGSNSLNDRLHRTEIELAEKKVQLREALTENEELIRQLRQYSFNSTDSDANLRPNSTVSWISKTVNSIKEATNSTNRMKVN